MAEFCKKHMVEVLGLTFEEHPEWHCGKGGLCEHCGWLGEDEE